MARMSKYPEVVGYLVRAAVVQGMSRQTQVYAVADGGNGLREALAQQFPRLTFILDRPHLKHHLDAGAEAIGLTLSQRHEWVSHKLRLIHRGLVKLVICVKSHRSKGRKRIVNLYEYLERFE